jgi:hypothetical protein
MGNEYKILRDSFRIHFDYDMLERPCPYPACPYKFCPFKTKELRSRFMCFLMFDTENPLYVTVDPKDWSCRKGQFIFARNGITKNFGINEEMEIQ